MVAPRTAAGSLSRWTSTPPTTRAFSLPDEASSISIRLARPYRCAALSQGLCPRPRRGRVVKRKQTRRVRQPRRRRTAGAARDREFRALGESNDGRAARSPTRTTPPDSASATSWRRHRPPLIASTTPGSAPGAACRKSIHLREPLEVKGAHRGDLEARFCVPLRRRSEHGTALRLARGQPAAPARRQIEHASSGAPRKRPGSERFPRS